MHTHPPTHPPLLCEIRVAAAGGLQARQLGGDTKFDRWGGGGLLVYGYSQFSDSVRNVLDDDDGGAAGRVAYWRVV